MEFVSSALRFFDNSASAFAALVPIVAILFSYWQSVKERHGEISKMRYMTLIAPLFDLAEPYMLRDGQCKTLNVAAIQVVLKQQAHLCGGNLRRYLRSNFSDKKEKDTFCKLISKEYDQMCKQLGIPRRSQRYRLQMYWPRFCVFQFIVYLGAHAFLAFAFLLTMLGLMRLAVQNLDTEIFLSLTAFLLAVFSLILSAHTRS